MKRIPKTGIRPNGKVSPDDPRLPKPMIKRENIITKQINDNIKSVFELKSFIFLLYHNLNLQHSHVCKVFNTSR